MKSVNSIIIYLILHFWICIGDSNFSNKKLNVVLFFTHIEATSKVSRKTDLGFLGFHDIGRVKYCSDVRNRNDLQDEYNSGPAFCTDSLKGSLTMLTRFCRTVMKMKTVFTDELSNDVEESEVPLHLSMDNTDPNRRKRYDSLENNDNDPNLKKKMAELDDKTLITGAKHTEVFEIRVKRKTQEENEVGSKKKEINVRVINDHNVPKEKPGEKHPWDIFDIMKLLRYSFLGKIFDNTVNDQIKADQEHLVEMLKLGQEKQDPGLFRLVQSTLDLLLVPPETGFLMVIFGAHLRSATDRHCPLMQSIRHVIENTDPDETLIVVTGCCPEQPEKSKEEIEKLEHYTMPVYAKGKNSDMLSQCDLLYDIPHIVRKILETDGRTGLKSP